MQQDITYALAFLAIFAWIILIYSVIARPSPRLSSPSSRGRLFLGRRRFRQERVPDLSDPGQQLLAVMSASFGKKRLLNPGEYKVFKIIEDEIASERIGYRVFPQISLGEVLASRDEDGFRSINSKRIDILVVDRGGWPVAAIEHQGGGHYQGMAAARDAVKREALRKAGVRYVETFANDSEDQIRLRVREQLGWKVPQMIRSIPGTMRVQQNFTAST